MGRKAREASVHYKECEPYSPFPNRAQAGIRELKRAVKQSMVKKSTPMRLWDYYCAKLQSGIWSSTAVDLYALGGMTPETLIKGSTLDISRLVKHTIGSNSGTMSILSQTQMKLLANAWTFD